MSDEKATRELRTRAWAALNDVQATRSQQKAIEELFEPIVRAAAEGRTR